MNYKEVTKKLSKLGCEEIQDVVVVHIVSGLIQLPRRRQ
jgi:hypothetical protein